MKPSFIVMFAAAMVLTAAPGQAAWFGGDGQDNTRTSVTLEVKDRTKQEKTQAKKQRKREKEDAGSVAAQPPPPPATTGIQPVEKSDGILLPYYEIDLNKKQP